MENENFYSKLKDIDEGLNIKIVEKWDKAFDMFIEGDVIRCYKSLKALYYMIRGYDFEVNEELDKITESVDQYLAQLENNGKPSNLRDKILIGRTSYEFRYLVEEYFKLIPKAFSEVGKWLKIYKFSNDRDKVFSRETFGTEVDLLPQKKEELKVLSTEDLLEMMNPNHVHHVHSRMLIKKAIVEGRR